MDDFLLDEDPSVDDIMDDDNGLDGGSEEIDDIENEDDSDLEDRRKKEEEESKDKYHGKLTAREIQMSRDYTIMKVGFKKDEDMVTLNGGVRMEEFLLKAGGYIFAADPANTSTITISKKIHEMFQTQGHARIVGKIFDPDMYSYSGNVDEDFGGTRDDGFNARYGEAYRKYIAKFVEYLATQDLSKDSAISRKTKQRLLPALIILLFSNNLYDLIIDCPTMPKVYDDMIKAALESISKEKRSIIELLAKRYESRGRTELAAKFRTSSGAALFGKEPAQLLGTKSLGYLKFTPQDIEDFREFKAKYNTITSKINQDVMNDKILVVLDEKAGLYEKLKDKTMSTALGNVKAVFKEWARNNPSMSVDFVNNIIWSDNDNDNASKDSEEKEKEKDNINNEEDKD